jgi:hypothetical protein
MAGRPVSASGFIASLVSSLAWPGLIAAIVLIFRRQFGTMLERLSRVRLGSGGDADPDWSRTESVIRESLVAARHPELAATGSPLAGPPRADGSPRPAERTPQGLVDDQWQALTDELRRSVRPSDSLSQGQLAHAEFDQLMEAALRAGKLDTATVRSLDGLRHLRNLSRGNSHLSQRQAEQFAVMADAVCYGIHHGAGRPGPRAESRGGRAEPGPENRYGLRGGIPASRHWALVSWAARSSPA